jgi:hypothetical protein
MGTEATRVGVRSALDINRIGREFRGQEIKEGVAGQGFERVIGAQHVGRETCARHFTSFGQQGVTERRDVSRGTSPVFPIRRPVARQRVEDPAEERRWAGRVTRCRHKDLAYGQ